MAAKQFEAYFINLMLKQARASMKGSVLDSQQSKFFTEMYDQQLALTMANRGGFGFAEMMIKQLTQQTSKPSVEAAMRALNAETNEQRSLRSEIQNSNTTFTQKNISAAVSKETTTQTQSPANQTPNALKHARGLKQYAQTQALFDQDGLPWNVGSMSRHHGFTRSLMPDSPEAFIEQMLPYAEEAAQLTGIPAKFIVAQAALETGWGKRQILRDNGENSHNLFGIKANRHWDGAVAYAVTTEYEQGLPVRKTEPFRAYDSYQACFNDYARLLTANSRYSDVLNQQDPEKFAYSLQDSGYATDPNYAEKLTNLILARNLHKATQ